MDPTSTANLPSPVQVSPISSALGPHPLYDQATAQNDTTDTLDLSEPHPVQSFTESVAAMVMRFQPFRWINQRKEPEAAKAGPQRPKINIILFTNILIRSDAHPGLTEQSRIYLDVVVDQKLCRRAPMAKEFAAPSWILTDVDLEISASIPSFLLAVNLELPDRPGKRLGSVELFSAKFLRQRADHHRQLVLVGEENDSPLLELAFNFTIMAVDPPLRPHPLFPESIDNKLLTRLCSFADEDYKEALLLPDGHPKKALRLHGVGNLFIKRYPLSQNIADLDMANLAYEKAVHLTADSDPNKPNDLSDLGHSYWRQFQLSRVTAHRDKSIMAFEGAAKLSPDSHSRKPVHLGNLGDFCLRRNRGVADIEMSIRAFKEAVGLVPEAAPARPRYLDGLSRSLFRRFELFDDIADIDKAILAAEDAVRVTADRHRNKPLYLKTLGASLLRRFERLGDIADIDKAILLLESAGDRISHRLPTKPSYLNDLAGALLRRFERSGDIADIDKSILALEEAARLTPDHHPVKPERMVNLGNSLKTRFSRLGDIADIERSILVVEEAVRLAPADHPQKNGYMGMLGACFLRRFMQLGNIADINKSVSAHEAAVELTPHGRPDESQRLRSFGFSLLNRFIRLGDITDLDKSILALENALRLISPDHPGRPSCMCGLGYSLLHRFQRLEDFADIEKSILMIEGSVQLTPDDHMAKSQRLLYLGRSFLQRFKSFHHHHDFDNAVLQYRRVANSSTGSPSVQLDGALAWARLVKGEPSLAMDAYTIVIDLLPRVAWLGLTISERHRVLRDVGFVATEAAAAAIECKKYETAVEWLDHGRSIVWGQLLRLRSPLDELRVVDAELADRLAQISRDLEQASTEDIFNAQDEQLSLEHAAQRHRQAAKEWDELIEKARAVRGFEDFLRSKKLEQLKDAARFGPVVVLNIHKHRCDALVIMAEADNVIHIPLNQFSYEKAQSLQRSLNTLLSNANIRTRHAGRVATRGGDTEFDTILSELWSDVVKPVLDRLEFPISDGYKFPRIWWCATGPLAFLPIHAAGLYNTTESGSKISDFVISSYTTTLSAILPKSREMPRRFQGLLVVTQPNTPNQKPLPNVEQEFLRIRSQATNVKVESLLGEKATVKSVLGRMQTCSWIHLACHAAQLIAEPTKSAFCLQDGDLELSEIIKLSLPHAEFAFLSACQTAQGNEKLSEEAVHLAAGMLSAGYQSVIATMWSIHDKDAPLIAADVYSDLLQGGEPDCTRAAHALHHALKRFRERSGESSFLSWVPFIHVGI